MLLLFVLSLICLILAYYLSIKINEGKNEFQKFNNSFIRKIPLISNYINKELKNASKKIFYATLLKNVLYSLAIIIIIYLVIQMI